MTSMDGLDPYEKPPAPGPQWLGNHEVEWRVWAPAAENVQLILDPDGQPTSLAMHRNANGFHYYRGSGNEGSRYKFQLPDGRMLPDPASRWQPEGVHGPSALVFPESFNWTDQQWRGIDLSRMVIYELHVGTFTPDGTFAGVIPRLPDLVNLGINTIELMPIAQFSGARNWGYDGVFPFAAHHGYGGPAGLQALVDAAHTHGIAVILDVVYNHLGPEGNCLRAFGPYFTQRHATPWGQALNFDGPMSDPVRQYVIDNALFWIRDFHIDGLRLDAIQMIFDYSANHVLTELQAEVRSFAQASNRQVVIIGETDQNDPCWVRPAEYGGRGLDAIWNDDWHHALHSLLTGEQHGYYQGFGSVAHLAKAIQKGFVYDGVYSPYRQRRHGSALGSVSHKHFVVYAQNHDQVGNRPHGDRLATTLSPAAQRFAATLLLSSSCTPMLFMGEEYGETRSFPFFSVFADAGLNESVRRGRQREFAALGHYWEGRIPDPPDENTFRDACLSWSWPVGSHQAGLRGLYKDLLSMRRQWPDNYLECPLSSTTLQLKDGTLLLWYRQTPGFIHQICYLANCSAQPMEIHAAMDWIANLAPCWSSEAAIYGGKRQPSDPWTSFYPYEVVQWTRAE